MAPKPDPYPRPDSPTKRENVAWPPTRSQPSSPSKHSSTPKSSPPKKKCSSRPTSRPTSPSKRTQGVDSCLEVRSDGFYFSMELPESKIVAKEKLGGSPSPMRLVAQEVGVVGGSGRVEMHGRVSPGKERLGKSVTSMGGNSAVNTPSRTRMGKSTTTPMKAALIKDTNSTTTPGKEPMSPKKTPKTITRTPKKEDKTTAPRPPCSQITPLKISTPRSFGLSSPIDPCKSIFSRPVSPTKHVVQVSSTRTTPSTPTRAHTPRSISNLAPAPLAPLTPQHTTSTARATISSPTKDSPTVLLSSQQAAQSEGRTGSAYFRNIGEKMLELSERAARTSGLFDTTVMEAATGDNKGKKKQRPFNQEPSPQRLQPSPAQLEPLPTMQMKKSPQFIHTPSPNNYTPASTGALPSPSSLFPFEKSGTGTPPSLRSAMISEMNDLRISLHRSFGSSYFDLTTPTLPCASTTPPEKPNATLKQRIAATKSAIQSVSTTKKATSTAGRLHRATRAPPPSRLPKVPPTKAKTSKFTSSRTARPSPFSSPHPTTKPPPAHGRTAPTPRTRSRLANLSDEHAMNSPTTSRPRKENFASADEIARQVEAWNSLDRKTYGVPFRETIASPTKSQKSTPRAKVASGEKILRTDGGKQQSTTPKKPPPYKSNQKQHTKPKVSPTKRLPVLKNAKLRVAGPKRSAHGSSAANEMHMRDYGAVRTPSKEVQNKLDKAIDEALVRDAKAGLVFTPGGQRISDLLAKRGKNC